LGDSNAAAAEDEQRQWRGSEFLGFSGSQVLGRRQEGGIRNKELGIRN
jgi:hypothetical protein